MDCVVPSYMNLENLIMILLNKIFLIYAYIKIPINSQYQA